MRMASGILAWDITTSAGVERTVTRPTTDMGHPTIAHGIMAWDLT